jgi:hypothetical protein
VEVRGRSELISQLLAAGRGEEVKNLAAALCHEELVPHIHEMFFREKNGDRK